MTSCFPLPPLHLDLKNIPRVPHPRPRISHRYRSKSESDVYDKSTEKASTASLPASPRSSSPTRIRRASGGSPGTNKISGPRPRHRFVRVVHNDECAGQEFENPHVIRRYSKKYWEESNIMRCKSLDEEIHSLPYERPSNTILKRHLSDDNLARTEPNSSPSLNAKHPQFCDDVKVIEFDRKEKIKKNIVFVHEEKLHIDEWDGEDEMDITSDDSEGKHDGRGGVDQDVGGAIEAEGGAIGEEGGDCKERGGVTAKVGGANVPIKGIMRNVGAGGDCKVHDIEMMENGGDSITKVTTSLIKSDEEALLNSLDKVHISSAMVT